MKQGTKGNALLRNLSAEESQWVNKTFTHMTVEERIGHLLSFSVRHLSPQELADLCRNVPLGAVHFNPKPVGELSACIEAIQSSLRIPALIMADIPPETPFDGFTYFPSGMACGAANDPDLMMEMGKAISREARYLGIHWVLIPVVDLNMNPQNPLVNIRSFGDNATRVSQMAVPLIKGLQEAGLVAASCKHFPGDGSDDRDQSFCTSMNKLTVDQWWKSYGRIWKDVINAGVMTILVGHISFPAYDGYVENPELALPATLSRNIQVHLLREELGFRGVVTSDASPMGGIRSRIRSDEAAVANILAGSDIFLDFDDPGVSFKRLLAAVHSGKISMAQVNQSVMRVLELKARLGLTKELSDPKPTEAELTRPLHIAAEIARKSVTLVRSNPMIPICYKPGMKVLTITVKYDNRYDRDLTTIDDELIKRGFHVVHLINPDFHEIIEKVDSYDCVFINTSVRPGSLQGTIRLTGKQARVFWLSWWIDHPQVIFTSFGSPYLLYEFPHLPNMILAYDAGDLSQKAVVRVWLGEQKPEGDCPVVIPSK